MRILVTGASGFIGSHLLPALAGKGHEAIAVSRTRPDHFSGEWRRAPELDSGSDWSRALAGADAVVHLAGRAMVGGNGPAESNQCMRANAEGTRQLARQAARCGIKHFIFLSSCHAVAAESDAMITAESTPHPSSAYGRSKLAAEKAVRQQFEGSTCAWTILRPPAVYGPGNMANITALQKAVKSGIPLPLASVHNRRSFLFVGNLVDVVAQCLDCPQQAAGKTFLPSDGHDVSTPELIRAIARAGKSVGKGGRWKAGVDSATFHPPSTTRHCARLFPFPESVLKAIARLPGTDPLRKLVTSLYVDSDPLRRDFGWMPPFTLDQALRQ